MSETTTTALARRFYESGMAPDVVAEIVADDLTWDITPGFPFGGIYHGWDDVATNFFGRVLQAVTSLVPAPEEYIGTDDRVVVQGHYEIVLHDGSDLRVRFVHSWTVENGKLARLRQTADSHIIQQRL